MSNIGLIIEERPSDIGNFLVGRLLPFKDKRTVGPFAFIDHMGPKSFRENENIDIGPHPHIGLSTLTYLFEGSMMHRDSLGNAIEIQPGEVNWMTSGKGIVHSERTPDHLRGSEKNLHGLQIWIALPKELEQMEPQFYHIDGEGLPVWNVGDITIKLIAGEAFGRRSEVPVYSKLYFLELKSKGRQHFSTSGELYGESGLYILEGSIESDGNTFLPQQLLVTKDSVNCGFTMNENTTVYIFGGDEFPEPRFIYWNFVATSKELIEDAKQRWMDRSFPEIEGENDFVPLPPQTGNFNLKQ